MSENASGHGRVGRFSGVNADGPAQKSAAIRNTVRGLLTSSTETVGGARTTPNGFAHMFGVCMLEMDIMARGQKPQTDSKPNSSMPRFVDVKLNQSQREAFLEWNLSIEELVKALETLPFDGYRVGLAWSGEQQSYTASLTCRNDISPNNGMCMTSFAKTSWTALKLMLYKHWFVTGGVWVSDAEAAAGDFG